MAADPFRNYDAWLEKPYQDAQRDGEDRECPECGAQLEVDTREQEVSCSECDYSYGTDWDSVAEARAEARADAMEDREL